MVREPLFWVLRGHRPVPTDDPVKWSKFLATGDRVVGQTNVGSILVSTVFLGINHNYRGGEPILFETMTFPGSFCERYATWAEAATGHARAVAMVRKGIE